MSDFKNEQISAFIDGESSDDHIDVIGKIMKSKDMKDTWTRYHLIGDCLRGYLPEKITYKVSENVSEILRDEPTVLAPQKSSGINLKPVAGFAIAASVAMVAVFSVQKGNQIDTSTPSIEVAQNNTNIIPTNPDANQFQNPRVLPAAVKKSDTPYSITNQRLNNYLMNHNEYRSNASINGILPYVRIVTIEPQE